MREIEVCPVCGSTKFETEITCKDYTVSGQLFTIIRCTNCQFLITSPAPEIKDLGNYYKSSSYISHTSKATTLIDQLYLLSRNYTIRWKTKIISDSLSSKSNINILDYGCGTGEFLQKCKNMGWQIAGVEPSSDARNRAIQNCQQSIATSIEEITSKDYQVITLWHVLEHVPDLATTLSQLREKLHKTGRLIIALPNHKSWDAKYYNKFWAAYDVPRHLWHFNQENVKTLLQDNGLTIVSKIPMRLDAFYVSLLSEKYHGNNQVNLTNISKALFNGLRSNLKARNTTEYSSLIYVAKQ